MFSTVSDEEGLRSGENDERFVVESENVTESEHDDPVEFECVSVTVVSFELLMLTEWRSLTERVWDLAAEFVNDVELV